MTFLKQIFWDEKFSRLRAGWRLAAQVILFIVIIVGFTLLTKPLDNSMPKDPLDKDVSILVSTTIGLSLFLSVWFAGRFIDRRRFADFGFRFNRGWWIDLAFGFALGALLQAGIFLIEIVSGWAIISGTMKGSWSGYTFPVSMVSYWFFFLWGGIYEEIWTRGYLIKNLAEGINFKPFGAKGAIWVAVIGTAIIFALGHMTNPGATVISTLAFLPAGLLYATSYILTGELAIPIGFHFAWNLFEGAVFGFPVSGYSLDASFIDVQVGGPELWTGGHFGPEAGLLGILARLVGILMILTWVWLRCQKLGLREELTSPDLLRNK